jgi:hypothetical protein
VVQDAREDTPAIDQDFALVISGTEATPGVGSIHLDRSAYTAPDAIYLTVIDTGLAGKNSTSVTLRSTSETAGEAKTLTSASPLGVFTGVVTTAMADCKYPTVTTSTPRIWISRQVRIALPLRARISFHRRSPT